MRTKSARERKPLEVRRHLASVEDVLGPCKYDLQQQMSHMEMKLCSHEYKLVLMFLRRETGARQVSGRG